MVLLVIDDNFDSWLYHQVEDYWADEDESWRHEQEREEWLDMQADALYDQRGESVDWRGAWFVYTDDEEG